jgi:ribonuclease HI
LIEAFFDAATDDNNKKRVTNFAIGVVIKQEGTVISSISTMGGQGGSNFAEFFALVACLKELFMLGKTGEQIVVYGDFKPAIDSMNGIVNFKPGIVWFDLYRQAIELKRLFSSISFVWIPGRRNTQAHELSRRPFLPPG